MDASVKLKTMLESSLLRVMDALGMLKPSFLWLELTNRCNADCVFCGRKYVGELHDMDFDLYKKIIDSSPSIQIVQTSGFGEPLLYPHIVEAIAYASRKKKYVRFSTNASLLNEDLGLQLLEAGLDEIRFSVDECSKERFESLRRGLKWETVLNNIKNFEKLKRRGGYGIKTSIRMTKTKENQWRIDTMRRFWRKIVKNSTVTKEVYIAPPNVLRRNMFSSGKSVWCKRVYQHLSVKNDGTVILCCKDWFSIYPMGNLEKESALDIFNGEKFSETRKSMIRGVKFPTICKYCKPKAPPMR